MRKHFYSILILNFIMLGVISCSTDFNQDVSDIVPTKGSADFSRYVALGNSLTSGYRDGALFVSAQLTSFPAIIAQQMKQAGGGEFNVPLMGDDLGGIPSVNFDNKLMLAISNQDLSPVRIIGVGTTTLDNIYSQGPYQNMGVPGAKVADLIFPGYGDINKLSVGANPYFVRFASSSNTTVLDDAMAQNPTFFSLGIGANDVLSYASSGGTRDQVTRVPEFKEDYLKIVKELTSKGAKGVLINIPDVVSIPFFTTVPIKPFASGTLTSDQIINLNRAYQSYNQAIQVALRNNLITKEEADLRQIRFLEGQPNAAVIVDNNLTDLSFLSSNIPNIRMSKSGDLILLTASAQLSQGDGTLRPLRDNYVLTDTELFNISTAIREYNDFIRSIANEYDLAFADIASLMEKLKSTSGIKYNGVTYTAAFATGGAFSLDGVHLTGRGYAFLANEIIKSINKKYGSTLSFVDPNSYHGIEFP